MKKIKTLNLVECCIIVGGCNCWCFPGESNTPVSGLKLLGSIDSFANDFESTVTSIKSGFYTGSGLFLLSESNLDPDYLAPTPFEYMLAPLFEGLMKNEHECKDSCGRKRMKYCCL